MKSSLQTCFSLGILAASVWLTTPVRAADPRSARSNMQGQPVSRQDAFFNQNQNRQNAYFSQPTFPQQPFNQNATILPPVFFAPMQLNYQGAPAGIIPGTGASSNTVLVAPGRSFQSGASASTTWYNVDSGSTSPVFILPMATAPVPQRVQSFTHQQDFTQMMPRQGLLGRW